MRLLSMSKVPPQRLLALNKVFYLLNSYHVVYVGVAKLEKMVKWLTFISEKVSRYHR